MLKLAKAFMNQLPNEIYLEFISRTMKPDKNRLANYIVGEIENNNRLRYELKLISHFIFFFSFYFKKI